MFLHKKRIAIKHHLPESNVAIGCRKGCIFNTWITSSLPPVSNLGLLNWSLWLETTIKDLGELSMFLAKIKFGGKQELRWEVIKSWICFRHAAVFFQDSFRVWRIFMCFVKFRPMITSPRLEAQSYLEKILSCENEIVENAILCSPRAKTSPEFLLHILGEQTTPNCLVGW